MFTKLSVRATLTSLMCVLLSGCLATVPGLGGSADSSAAPQEPAVSADPRLTQGDQADFFSRSGYEACLVAGGGTALICLATGAAPAKCLLGAVAVCGVAMGANYYLDVRRLQYSNATKRLEAMQADVALDTKRVIERTATMRTVIRDDKKRMAELQRSIKSKKVDTEAARRDLAKIDKNIELMNKDLTAMKSKAENYSKVLEEEKTGGAKSKRDELKRVEAEIQKLNSQVAVLQNEIDGAYAQRSAITLG